VERSLSIGIQMRLPCIRAVLIIRLLHNPRGNLAATDGMEKEPLNLSGFVVIYLKISRKGVCEKR
jgi:hypothetical protein